MESRMPEVVESMEVRVARLEEQMKNQTEDIGDIKTTLGAVATSLASVADDVKAAKTGIKIGSWIWRCIVLPVIGAAGYVVGYFNFDFSKWFK